MTDVEQAMEVLQDEATIIDQIASGAERQFGDILIAEILGPIPDESGSQPIIRDFAH